MQAEVDFKARNKAPFTLDLDQVNKDSLVRSDNKKNRNRTTINSIESRSIQFSPQQSKDLQASQKRR